MMKRALRLLPVVLSMTVLAGCANLQHKDVNTLNSEEAAQKVALDTQIDSALERVKNQPHWSSSADDRAQFASFATNSVSVSYQGSAESLMRAIAAARGKTFRVTGPEPHMPIFVFVEAKGVAYTDFMRDLDKQFGQRAQVVLTNSAVELNYRH